MSSVVGFLLLALAADRLTKALVAWLGPASRRLFARPWLELRPVRHVFTARGPRETIPLLILFGLVLGGVTLLVRSGLLLQHPAAQAALGLALGGAASNLYDRLRHGSILNFVRVGWWPVFNLADAAIVVGVVVAVMRMRGQ